MAYPAPLPDLGLAGLGICGTIDADGVDVFDRYARLIATLVGTPMAAVSFLDAGAWCKSVVGLAVYDKTRCGVFCAQTMLGNGPLAVSDAARDARFADAPSVRGEPGVRFYLGLPLRLSDGPPIGAVSAFDTVVRQATPEAVARLTDLADVVATSLSLYKTMQEVKYLALRDPLTGLANRIHLYQALGAARDAAWDHRRPFSVLLLDCDRFKHLNDTLGHLVGDQALQALAAMLRDSLDRDAIAARLGGDEFVVMLPHAGAPDAAAVAERILLRGRDLMTARGWRTTLSIGAVTFAVPPASVELALALADEAMYHAKYGGGDQVNCVVVDAPTHSIRPGAPLRQISS